MSDNDQNQPHIVDFPGLKVGWTRGAAGDPMVIGNPALGGGTYIRHVVMVGADGLPQYDQVVKLEKGGAVTLPFRADTSQIGLISVWRALVQPNDMPTWSQSYPDVSVTSLGGYWREAPRGFPEVGDKSATDTSVRETEGETGTAVTDTQFLGFLSGNTTFETQLTAAFLAYVDPTLKGRFKKDPNEKILRVDWFSRHDLLQLRESGQLVCGFTLSAIAALDLAHPGLFR